MSRKQAALIILVNAVISALITAAAILLVILPHLEKQHLAATTPTVGTSAAETPAGSLNTPAPILHVVVSGDTISALALKYDVPAAEIIAANQLENPNFLQVGSELIIPIGGVPNATATFTPAPTATDTPLPFEPPSTNMTATAAATMVPLRTPLPSTGELQIEITEVIKPGVLDEEAVVVTNVGTRLADMQGWTLRDAEGNVYTFPNFRLWGGGNATVHSRAGQDGSPPSNFYWARTEPAWSPSEIVTLQDAEGRPIASYIVGR